MVTQIGIRVFSWLLWPIEQSLQKIWVVLLPTLSEKHEFRVYRYTAALNASVRSLCVRAPIHRCVNKVCVSRQMFVHDKTVGHQLLRPNNRAIDAKWERKPTTSKHICKHGLRQSALCKVRGEWLNIQRKCHLKSQIMWLVVMVLKVCT